MTAVMEALIRHLVDTRYETLPSDVVDATKKQILDTLAVTIGGSTCSVGGELQGLVDLVREWGGKEESTIIAFGGRAPAPDAALVNAILCVRLDFDDTLADVHSHPSRAVVPTAFATGERQGRVTGKELITAVALGVDLECRVKQAVGHDIGSPFGMPANFLGAAATAGKILRLNGEKLRYALGLAFLQISGATGMGGSAASLKGPAASLKGMNNGFAARAGIMSALFAQRGFAATADFLEPGSRNNFYDLFFSGLYWPWLLTFNLGKVFAGSHTSLKEFPCCHGQHTAIEAALALVAEHGLKADAVDTVLLRVSPLDYFLLAEPLERKQNPENRIEAQFSICWGVASAIVYGEVGIRNFSDEGLRDTRVREIARRVRATPDMELAKGRGGFTPSIVEIRSRDGMAYSRRVEFPVGSPQTPIGFADVAMKFKRCCEYSAKPIGEESRDRAIEMVKGLEEVDDISRIVRLLG